MATLINGNGNPTVYAGQDSDLIAALAGNITGIAKVGSKFAATAVDANTISVSDGVIITKEGRRIQLDAGSTDAFSIPTGTAGTTNYYIIGYLLTTESDSSQVAETFVQLMESSTATIEEDTFRSGATDVYVSLYRVEQDGVNLGTITGLLPELNNIANSAGAAEDITYDNTSSGLTADNVQEAIDEINDDLSNKLPETFNLGERVSIPFGTDYITPSPGYVIIGGFGEGILHSLSLNGTNVITIKTRDAIDNETSSLFVGKGVTLKFTGSGSGTTNARYFIPLNM